MPRSRCGLGNGVAAVVLVMTFSSLRSSCCFQARFAVLLPAQFSRSARMPHACLAMEPVTHRNARLFAEDLHLGRVSILAVDIDGEVFEVIDQLLEVLRSEER